MNNEDNNLTGDEMEQIKIILNSIYLCLDYAVKYIATRDGTEAAAEFKAGMLDALKNGDIDMALLEESRTYDFVVSKIDALAVPEG